MCPVALFPLQLELAGDQAVVPQTTAAVFGGRASPLVDVPVSWSVAASLLFVTAGQPFLTISAHTSREPWSPQWGQ